MSLTLDSVMLFPCLNTGSSPGEKKLVVVIYVTGNDVNSFIPFT